MARSRTIKRPRKQKNSISFFPESLQAFIARRLVDTIALLTFIAAIFIILSISSYNSADPSWNTSIGESNQEIYNIGSIQGAIIADILLQTLGIGAFILPLTLSIWAYRIFKRQTIRPVSLRFITIFISCIFASIAFSQILPSNLSTHPFLENGTSILIINKIISTLSPLNIPYINYMISLTSIILSLSIFLYSAAFNKYEIVSIWFRIKILAFTIANITVSSINNFYSWVKRYNEPEYKSEPINLGIIEKLNSIKAERAKAKEEYKKSAKVKKEISTLEKPYNKKPYKNNKNNDDIIENNSNNKDKPISSIPVIKPQSSSEKLNTRTKDNSQARFALSEEGIEWELPPISLIQDVPQDIECPTLNEDALRRNAELLRNVLADFNIQGEIVKIHPGPVVTLYELEPAPGTKSSKVISLSDDIARSMSAISVRCAVVPGRNVIGIELPNKIRQTVYMKEMLASRLYEKTDAKLPLILGKDIGGQPILADLAKMPHLLVAGTTGSGKSVAVNTMIMSLLYRLSPEKCRFIMIDPKMLELSVYDNIPHLLTPVVTEPGKAVVALKWAVHEMEERYRNMSKLGVRNIDGYNARIREAIKNDEQIMHKVQTGFDPETGKAIFEDKAMELVELPYIVIIVDEFADLMLVAGKDVENAIQRLAQMARAAGIHLIMATQRPSVDVITGVVKANFPTRISFQVTSKIDSRTILGEGGAEQLLGMGDMLYMAPGGRITRVHGPFVSDDDVEKATDFLRSQGKPNYIDGVTSEDSFESTASDVMNAMFSNSNSGDSPVDELYDKAVAIIAREGKVSTSFIQRHLQIGYNRAARIIEEMERQGVISPASSTGKRQILISDFSDA